MQRGFTHTVFAASLAVPYRTDSRMSLIRHYLTLIIFAAGLLLGVQVPSFVDQYEKRLDAHYLEANEDLSGFQKIADLFHNGSIEALIEKHERSSDPTFRAEAGPIKRIYQRKLKFGKEMKDLQGPFAVKVVRVLLTGDRSILRETYRNYSANLPLNTSAVACGLVFAASISVIFELGAVLLKAAVRLRRRGKRTGTALPLRFR